MSKSTTTAPVRQISIRHWRPFNGESRTLIGFFSIVLESGMVINDCRMQRSNDGQIFIGLPQRQYQDDEGATKYARHIEFVDRETNDRFQAKVLDAFRREHPEVQL